MSRRVSTAGAFCSYVSVPLTVMFPLYPEIV